MGATGSWMVGWGVTDDGCYSDEGYDRIMGDG